MEGAHNPSGHRVFLAKRRPDGNGPLTYMQPAAVGKLDGGKWLLRLNLDNGKVRTHIALDRAVKNSAIRKLYSYLAILGAFNNVVICEDVAIGTYDNARTYTCTRAGRRRILTLTLSTALTSGLTKELEWVNAFTIPTKTGDTASARCGNFRLNTDRRWTGILGNIDKCAFQRAGCGAVFRLGALGVIRLERSSRREEHRDGGEGAADRNNRQWQLPQTGDEFRHWVSPNGFQWVIASPKDIALPGLYETGI